MKKIVLNIAALMLWLCLGVGVYYTSRNGLVLFKDSQQTETLLAMKRTMDPVKEHLGKIQKQLQDMASRDLIVFSLAQFEKGESLERSSLAFKQSAGEIPYTERLQLVNMDKKIVIDTADPTLEGRTLALRKISFEGKNGGSSTRWLLQPDGRMIAAVPCNTAAGRFVGMLLAYFKSRLFSEHAVQLGIPAKNVPFLFFNNILFYNLPEKLQQRSVLATVSQALQISKENKWQQGNVTILIDRITGFPFVFAYASDRDQLGIPDSAFWILGGLGVLVLFQVLLLILSVKNRRVRRGIMEIRQDMDRVGGEIARAGASADEIIRQSEYLFQEQHMVERRLEAMQQQTVEEVSVEQVTESHDEADDDGLVSVNDILAASDNEGYTLKDKDDELEALINRVAAEDQQSETGDEETVSATLISAQSLEQYWERMHDILRNSMQLSAFALLERDDAGNLNSAFVEGVPRNSACRFTAEEKITASYFERGKVVYLNERVMQNNLMRQKFPDLDPDVVAQAAMIPVFSNGLLGVLIVFRKQDEKPLDKYMVYELMYMSRL